MNRLDGKVCVVTGAGAMTGGVGNGSAVAMTFAREGAAAVVVNDVDPAAADRTVAAITQDGGSAAAFVGDLTREDDARGLVEFAESTYGRLDVLHNNIGGKGPGTVAEITAESWNQAMDINVTTMVLASKYAVPALERAGGGSIINIASIAAMRPHGMAPYSTAKGAVIALTQAMATDHAKAGIRVNAIAPGPVYSTHVAADMSSELRALRAKASPLGIEGSPWDVAYAAVYLASDEARWVTGVILPVDGGVLLTSAER